MEWCKLGEYIERIERTNGDGKYSVDDVRGVTNAKGIIPTKANIDGRALEKFLVVGHNEFAVNRRVHDKLGLGINRSGREYIFTNDYVAFRIKNEKRLDPIFLYIFFCRDEFDRSVLYHAWGSATLFFNYDDICEIVIPVPPIAEQRKVVEAWQGLRALKEQNEQLAAPLLALCRSYLQELKKTWPMVEIGDCIEACDERNGRMSINEVDLRGVTSEGIFDDTKAITTGIDFSKYKIVRKGTFAYNPSRISLGSIALNLDHDYIVSPMYLNFKVTECGLKKLNAEYLRLWFMRPEFLRSTTFYAKGSVRDVFGFQEMQETKIPLPPLDVQQAVVDLYRCANEAKKIAAEADVKSRAICPALMQWVVKEAV